MALTGDFRALDEMITRLSRMADAVPKIAVVAAPKIAEEIVASVGAGHDPNGVAFSALKAGRGAPLATLTDPAKVTVRGTSIFARVSRRIPRYLNRGRRLVAGRRGGAMPARPIIPTEGSSVPATWQRFLTAAAEFVMGERAR